MGLDGEKEEEGEEEEERICVRRVSVNSFSFFILYVRVREGIGTFMVDRIIYGVVFSFDMVHLGGVVRVCGHVLGREEDVRGVTGHYTIVIIIIYNHKSISRTIHVL